MNDYAKYIVVNHMFPVIFDIALTHRTVALGLMRDGKTITGAGFVCINQTHDLDGTTTKIVCSGRSESLNIGVDPMDEQIIKHFLTKQLDS